MAWRRTPSKFGNTRASFNGKTYHSALERNDAMWLHTLEQEGRISDLREQVRYRVVVNGAHVCDSIVDFRFHVVGSDKTWTWFETKGFPTDVWKLKKKLIEATIPDDEEYLVNATEKQLFTRVGAA